MHCHGHLVAYWHYSCNWLAILVDMISERNMCLIWWRNVNWCLFYFILFWSKPSFFNGFEGNLQMVDGMRNWSIYLGYHIGGYDKWKDHGFALVEECLTKRILEFNDKLSIIRHREMLAVKGKHEGNGSSEVSEDTKCGWTLGAVGVGSASLCKVNQSPISIHLECDSLCHISSLFMLVWCIAWVCISG